MHNAWKITRRQGLFLDTTVSKNINLKKHAAAYVVTLKILKNFEFKVHFCRYRKPTCNSLKKHLGIMYIYIYIIDNTINKVIKNVPYLENVFFLNKNKY